MTDISPTKLKQLILEQQGTINEAREQIMTFIRIHEQAVAELKTIPNKTVAVTTNLKTHRAVLRAWRSVLETLEN